MPDEKDLHSTGRGGSGNIGKGEGTYADPAILPENNLKKPTTATTTPSTAPTPKMASEEHSTGRGGQGNIVPDAQVVGADAPTTEEGGAQYADYHTGRGGEGNIHRERFGGHSKAPKEGVQHPEGQEHEHGRHSGLVEKAKHAVGLDRK